MIAPTRYDNQGTWNAGVERGPDRAARVALLATVPERYRLAVMAHVACYFRVKAAKGRRALG